jgi:Protein of unknown function (DUF2997)
MAEEIEIEISPNGQVVVRTIGIKGAKCIDAAEFIANIVGREESRILTSEFHEAEQQVERHQEIRRRH